MNRGWVVRGKIKISCSSSVIEFLLFYEIVDVDEESILGFC